MEESWLFNCVSTDAVNEGPVRRERSLRTPCALVSCKSCGLEIGYRFHSDGDHLSPLESRYCFVRRLLKVPAFPSGDGDTNLNINGNEYCYNTSPVEDDDDESSRRSGAIRVPLALVQHWFALRGDPAPMPSVTVPSAAAASAPASSSAASSPERERQPSTSSGFPHPLSSMLQMLRRGTGRTQS
jgi:hypothetical protein